MPDMGIGYCVLRIGYCALVHIVLPLHKQVLLFSIVFHLLESIFITEQVNTATFRFPIAGKVLRIEAHIMQDLCSHHGFTSLVVLLEDPPVQLKLAIDLPKQVVFILPVLHIVE